MKAEDFEAPPVEVWPDNVQAFEVFGQMGTQWRVGMGGAIGLDYGALPFVLRMSRVPRDQWAPVFEGIRVMENAALSAMSEG
ncbi:DUF1799 domain-containing protein [Cupriavidus basilensis]|uniref:DUF1799 domain-containing protein n=1 Tax=Cupriavidus basilensis TaxID=68895 RepID=UPI0039F6871D